MEPRNVPPPRRSALVLAGPHACAEAVACANSFAVAVGLSDDATARLAIIVEELVLNLVDQSVAGQIGLELTHVDTAVTLVLTDLGEPFDPRSAPLPEDLPPERGGGAGLAMVRAWARIDDYARVAGRNRLTLTVPD